MALTTTLINASNQTVYTSSATSPVLGNAITSIILCNTSNSTSATVTIYAVPNSAGSVGAASASNMIVNALPIPAVCPVIAIFIEVVPRVDCEM